MGLLSDIERLNRELDERPGDQLLRYMLADCLEESAGTVECPKCWPYIRVGKVPADQWLRNPAWLTCNRCTGTGRVSDGRRERAEGYRVLAQLDRVPWKTPSARDWFFSDWTMPFDVLPNSGPDRSELPVEWLAAIGVEEDSVPGSSRTRCYPTRREAEDAAALAWGNLPADVRAKILGK